MRLAYGFFRTRGTSAKQDWFMSHLPPSNAQNDERAAAILSRKASGVLAHDEALIELADADCAAAIAGLIAERVRLRAELVLRALEAPSMKNFGAVPRRGSQARQLLGAAAHAPALPSRHRKRAGAGAAVVLRAVARRGREASRRDGARDGRQGPRKAEKPERDALTVAFVACGSGGGGRELYIAVHALRAVRS